VWEEELPRELAMDVDWDCDDGRLDELGLSEAFAVAFFAESCLVADAVGVALVALPVDEAVGLLLAFVEEAFAEGVAFLACAGKPIQPITKPIIYK
jgi:hypothetical protein